MPTSCPRWCADETAAVVPCRHRPRCRFPVRVRLCPATPVPLRTGDHGVLPRGAVRRAVEPAHGSEAIARLPPKTSSSAFRRFSSLPHTAPKSEIIPRSSRSRRCDICPITRCWRTRNSTRCVSSSSIPSRRQIATARPAPISLCGLPYGLPTSCSSVPIASATGRVTSGTVSVGTGNTAA